jgi:peptidoglycan/xylan/chitin deacetylase (PgdA/CDA1 family)
MKTSVLSLALCASLFVAISTLFLIQSCESVAAPPAATTMSVAARPDANTAAKPAPPVAPTVDPANIADAATIIARKQIPILCYHQVRDYKPTDSKTARDYIVPPAVFREQMQALADSGYKTILPDELYNYLAAGIPVPEKSVMLTFDDTDLEQFTVAAPEMKQRDFKGVFFVMTVSIGRPRYMSKEQLKLLSDDGNIIGSHTWDHHNVKKYAGDDWITQIEKPSKQLAAITGKPVTYFAYPFGLWNPPAIPELKKRGFKAAFQLSEKRDQRDPLFTIRRIIVPGSWSGKTMLARMRSSFR